MYEDRWIKKLLEKLVIAQKDIVVFDGVGTFNHLQDIFCFLVSFHEVGVRHHHLEGVVVYLIESFFQMRYLYLFFASQRDLGWDDPSSEIRGFGGRVR